MFLSPAVTPWFSTLPGVGSNNPGIRLYRYSRQNHSVVDYTQYFLNLTAATAASSDNWTIEYRATDAYGILSVDAASLSNVIQKFADESQSPDLFMRYYRYNSVSYNVSNCTGQCKRQQICAASEILFDNYRRCVDSSHSAWQSTTMKPHHRHHAMRVVTYILLASLILLIMVLFLLLAIFCCRRRHAVVYFSRSHYSLIPDA